MIKKLQPANGPFDPHRLKAFARLLCNLMTRFFFFFLADTGVLQIEWGRTLKGLRSRIPMVMVTLKHKDMAIMVLIINNIKM